MIDDSTICAIATPPGNGAIAIVRLSGTDTYKIAGKLISFQSGQKDIASLPPNTIHLASISSKEDELIDDVMVSLFRAPHSYTGEDLIELSCHGAHYIQQKILELMVTSGARLAEPGEFTLRAFLNNKMDLSQAEAVADLIASTSAASHKVAINQMRGGFSTELAKLREQLLDFISLIELELDFSEEDVEFADRKKLSALVDKIQGMIWGLADSFRLGNVIKNGVPVAITGKTNVGKSTLLNALLHDDRAIVSEIAGTTRDVIEDLISIDGISFRFIDTAGLRQTSDTVESIGVEKTFEKINQAYIVLYVIDAAQTIEEIDRLVGKIKKRLEGSDRKLFILLNKIDFLTDKHLAALQDLGNFKNLEKDDQILYISASYGDNVDQLASLLVETIKHENTHEHDVVITNARHFEALVNAGEAINRVQEGLKTELPSDLVAQDIRQVLHYLGEITGEVTTDEILGNIFSKFCIGK
ncbi:MAG: tRNA uridine-5-carboxymethylaminomethyl(34) synthesis GTPase MnmE [Bacteroidales bacterium]|nr:tRNA uridine-5-carboxymethylaminomethyl(34) synthesis GTPase MnmE [Bacteroidales bacterium]